MTTLLDRYYYSHFTDEKAEAWNRKSFSQSHKAVNDGMRILVQII